MSVVDARGRFAARRREVEVERARQAWRNRASNWKKSQEALQKRIQKSIDELKSRNRNHER